MAFPTHSPITGVLGWVPENWAELGGTGAVPGGSCRETSQRGSWGQLREVVVRASGGASDGGSDGGTAVGAAVGARSGGRWPRGQRRRCPGQRGQPEAVSGGAVLGVMTKVVAVVDT